MECLIDRSYVSAFVHTYALLLRDAGETGTEGTPDDRPFVSEKAGGVYRTIFVRGDGDVRYNRIGSRDRVGHTESNACNRTCAD